MVISAVFVSASAFAADPDHGKTLAQRWCVNCHLVGPDQHNATTDAPPFASVAKMPDFNESRLAFFLLDPHPKMPNMQLTRDDATDLAAYIASLGTSLSSASDLYSQCEATPASAIRPIAWVRICTSTGIP